MTPEYKLKQAIHEYAQEALQGEVLVWRHADWPSLFAAIHSYAVADLAARDWCCMPSSALDLLEAKAAVCDALDATLHPANESAADRLNRIADAWLALRKLQEST